MKPLVPRRVVAFHRHQRRSPASRPHSVTHNFSEGMLPESTVVRRALAALAFVTAVLFSCLLLYGAPYSLRFFPPWTDSSSGGASALSYVFTSVNEDVAQDTEEHRLEKVLKAAAMEDKTVILTTLNEAWAAPNSIIDLFLESFRIGDHTRRLLNHLVIIALDQKAYKRCLAVHTNCFALLTEGVDFSGEAYFMTNDYLKMMWRRIDFLRTVLEMGYNFVFTDADIMWFRNPFPRFYNDTDFQIACDHFTGNPDDVQNRPNGGFNYVKSSNRSVEFYKFWYAARERYPGNHDQDVLNIIKFDPFIVNIGLNLRFLDTAYFGGFCEPSRDLNQVCTMHANCCFGLGNKLHDLRIMLQDWKLFMSLPPSLKRSLSSWRVPKNCSLPVPQVESPLL